MGTCCSININNKIESRGLPTKLTKGKVDPDFILKYTIKKHFKKELKHVSISKDGGRENFKDNMRQLYICQSEAAEQILRNEYFVKSE